MLILAILVLIVGFIAFGLLPTIVIGAASVIGYREMYGNSSPNNSNSNGKK